MRRLALGLAALWFLAAFGFRLCDMQRPQIYISALTGGQRHAQSTLAWVEGALPSTSQSGKGRLIVVDVRIDGKLERHASATLPTEWPDCRLWLEESPATIQAVVLCPGHTPLRLTAAGTSLSGLGPSDHPPELLDVFPLVSIEPEKIVSQIHRHDLAPRHPLLFFLGLLCVSPLIVLAVRDLRTARRLRQPAVIEGVMEQAGPGSLTIRDGQRRVSVYIEQGEVISVGLGRGVTAGDAAMAVDGLHASVQGAVDQAGDTAAAPGFYRGTETLRLRRGAILVVGDIVSEARRRLCSGALYNAAVAAAGTGLALATAMGLLW